MTDAPQASITALTDLLASDMAEVNKVIMSLAWTLMCR